MPRLLRSAYPVVEKESPVPWALWTELLPLEGEKQNKSAVAQCGKWPRRAAETTTACSACTDQATPIAASTGSPLNDRERAVVPLAHRRSALPASAAGFFGVCYRRKKTAENSSIPMLLQEAQAWRERLFLGEKLQLMRREDGNLFHLSLFHTSVGGLLILEICILRITKGFTL